MLCLSVLSLNNLKTTQTISSEKHLYDIFNILHYTGKFNTLLNF